MLLFDLIEFLDKIWNFGTVCCKMSRKMIFRLYIGNTYAPAPFFCFLRLLMKILY